MLVLYPLTKEQKFNPLAAHLMHHYYTSKTDESSPKIKIPVFNLNSTRDIPLIMHAAKLEKLERYGIVVVTGGRHRTPLLVDGDRVCILESLGTEKSKVGISSVAQIAIAVKRFDKRCEILTFEPNRQVDSLSCGTDAYMALKEAAKLGKDLFSYIDKQSPKEIIYDEGNIIDSEEKKDNFFTMQSRVKKCGTLPPSIAKYCQASSSILSHPQRYDSIVDKHGKEENMIMYFKRNQKIESIPLNSKKSVKFKDPLYDVEENIELNSRKITLANAAIRRRREKHARIVADMLATMSQQEVENIVKESAGINLILKHLDNLPKSAFASIDRNLSEMTGKSTIVHEYIAEEMAKRRDESTGIAPNGSVSLTELAAILYIQKHGQGFDFDPVSASHR